MDPTRYKLGPMKDERLEGPQGADAQPGATPTKTLSPTAEFLTPDRLREVANHLLDFLSNASNETLGACLVGLGTCTYFVLGRVGLVVIGVVGGAILHATWEDNGRGARNEENNAEESKRRKEIGIDVVKRVLEWRYTNRSAVGLEEEYDIESTIEPAADRELDFEGFQPVTKAALTDLTNAVVRDYVKWWYGPLLPADESFPSTCRRTLSNFILTFSTHLARKRPADSFVDFLTNTSSIMIVFVNELSAALMSPELNHMETSDALDRYLQDNPESHLANVTDRDQQMKKLKAVSDDVLHNFLDSKAYNCEPVRVFSREVLAGLILDMTIESCSKPEFINGWIVYLLEEVDTKLIDAIDAGVGGATSHGVVKAPPAAPENDDLQNTAATEDTATAKSEARPEHRGTVSTAEDPMEEAMREAKRLTELIAAEEAKNSQELVDRESSGTTTANGPTPTSSESDLAASSQSFEDDTAIPPMPALEATSTPRFTSFDQILPRQQTTALHTDDQSSTPIAQPLTLHNASISIFDDEQPDEKAAMRSKPTIDYLIQVEPATSQHPGWMIPRKYMDFETLHEVLRRISVVSGVAAFAERHAAIPAWKNRTKAALRNDLEHYLRDALSFTRLAESEGMKRFLEKDQGLSRSSPGTKQGGFSFPSPAVFETMGKGMLDVLSSAPKGAASGGKAVVGGFTGVLGLGQKKNSPASVNRPANRSISRPSSTLSRVNSSDSVMQTGAARQSADSLRNANGMHPDSIGVAQFPERPTYVPQKLENGHIVPADTFSNTPPSASSNRSLEDTTQPELHLPPPPSEIPDDYHAFQDSTISNIASTSNVQPHSRPPSRSPSPPQPLATQSIRPPPLPLTEPESRIIVELFFAILTELYTLSASTWSIRLTLLRTAKTYLLRPGNPSLSSIRSLIQDTIITAQTSDAGIASHINKIRENVLPTDEERAKWPKELTDEEKERLRVKARRLLVERGLPAAVRGVVGQAATGEAMRRIFDALQVERVARGWVFACLLQAVRAVAQ